MNKNMDRIECFVRELWGGELVGASDREFHDRLGDALYEVLQALRTLKAHTGAEGDM